MPCVQNFNPRAPCGARRYTGRRLETYNPDFNPRAPCGARPNGDFNVSVHVGISIHAPLAGRDEAVADDWWEQCISIHAPLAGRDAHRCPPDGRDPPFQSTRPLRGATRLGRMVTKYVLEFQSTRPLRGATGSAECGDQIRVISIHAPLAGRDGHAIRDRLKLCDFNPRAPCGARRFPEHRIAYRCRISIHAPLAGRDADGYATVVDFYDFNPRAPCGARRCWHPARPRDPDFNPRAPCGARLWYIVTELGSITISIHAPLAGRDHTKCALWRQIKISIHAPLAGRDRPIWVRLCSPPNFNPRAPCGARPESPGESSP